MRVLAFDPGYERLGIAVLEKQSGKEVLLYSSCVRTPVKLAFDDRLGRLGAAAEEYIAQWQPEAIALEEVFFEKNAKTAMHIAEVRGALMYIAAKHKLKAYHYSPGEVKIAVTGYGGSDKKAIAAMVPKILRMSRGKRLDDELDAIAVGITCLASVR